MLFLNSLPFKNLSLEKEKKVPTLQSKRSSIRIKSFLQLKSILFEYLKTF